jgi:hypothetical protein
MSKDQRDVSLIDKGKMSEPIAWTNKKNLKYLQIAGSANIWNQSVEKNDIPLYAYSQTEITQQQAQKIAELEKDLFMLQKHYDQLCEDCTCQGGHSEAYLKAKGKL